MSDEGRLVAERYRLAERIGRGGMGTVWRAADELLGRQVAIKQLHISPHLADDELATMYERTRREARSAARIAHPNVVVVHDVVDDRGVPCIVMEYVPSTTLADVLKRKGRIEPEEAARIGRGMIAALRAAHAAGVLHRDVKPGNVLLGTGGHHDGGYQGHADATGDAAGATPWPGGRSGTRATGGGPLGDGRVVLTDFGIAVASGTSTLTKTGELVGSIDYVAPERVKGGKPGPASDLWALGATLYQALEGRPPFRKDTAFETAYAIAVDELPPLRYAGVLGRLVEALLAKDPEARPTAETVEWTLRAAAADAETELMRSSLLPERGGAGRATPEAVAPPAVAETIDPAPDTAPTQVNGGVRAAGATRGTGGGSAAEASPGTASAPAHTPTPTPAPGHTDGGTAPTHWRTDPRQPHQPHQRQAPATQQQSHPQQPQYQHQSPARQQPQAPHGQSAQASHQQSPVHRGGHPAPGGSGSDSATTTPTAVGAPPAPNGKRRGRATLWGAVTVALVAAVAGAVVVYLAVRDDGKDGVRAGGGQSAPQTPGGGKSPSTTAAPRPKPAPVPEGYRLVHEEDLGVAFPVPEGWTRKSGTGEQVDYVDPTGKVGIKINVLDFATDDHLEHFEEVETQWREREPSLKRLRMQRTTFRGSEAAIWEFSFRGSAREFRGIDLGFGEEGKEEYAIYVSGPSAEWSQYRPIFDVIKDSFHTADDVKNAKGEGGVGGGDSE
ncbi:protein kinase [Streptomyces sp. NPDC057702]|uniref:serine/threonine-protein kinase n=1 Tax=unclassified Streptomyces TaxID=2593676 RepID=UPI0036B4739E